MKPGRNEPCSCGSGRKFKQCCLPKESLAASSIDKVNWCRLNRLLADSRQDLLRFVIREYGAVALDEAWSEFTGYAAEGFDPESPHLPVFMPWFYHCWSPDQHDTQVRNAALHEVIPTVAYLANPHTRIEPILRRYLDNCVVSAFSFFDIVAADPGRGLRLRDIFTQMEFDVTERTASTTLKAGDVLFAQLGGTDGILMLEACSPFAIPPIWKEPVIRLRGSLGEISDPRALRAHDLELLELYHDLSGKLLNPQLPELGNTDGDPLMFLRLVFDITSAQETFDALRHLATEEPDESLSREMERDSNGELVWVRFDWMRKANPQHLHLDNVILGSLEMSRGRLTIDVNSEKACGGRAEVGREGSWRSGLPSCHRDPAGRAHRGRPSGAG